MAYGKIFHRDDSNAGYDVYVADDCTETHSENDNSLLQDTKKQCL